MGLRTDHKTPLERVLRLFGLKPSHVVQTAARIASEMGLRGGISRQHLGRLRAGRVRATEEKILVLVTAIRELTGFAIRAADLFPIEPVLSAASGPPLTPDASGHGGIGSVALSSGPRPSQARRLAVPDETGDEAFESLYVEYGVLLRSIAMRRYGVPPDDAEALVHDAFVAYLQRHTHIREVKPWLMGAVSNCCKHYWRDRKRDAPMPEGFEDTPDRSESVRVERWAWQVTVAAIIAQLGDRCRETLKRYYWRQESKEAIAETLSTSPGNVLQLLVTCRRRVRDLLQGTARRKS